MPTPVCSVEFIHSSAGLRVPLSGLRCILSLLFSESKNEKERVIFSFESILESYLQAVDVPTLCSICCGAGSEQH